MTFQQQRSIQDRRIERLSDLDLAALLRAPDQNWHELSAIEPLPREARNWVKELQAVRNRWAHAPRTGFSPPQDTYRDADTLSRLFVVLGAEPEILIKVEQFKEQTLA
jgi:ATP-dependent helicase HepA